MEIFGEMLAARSGPAGARAGPCTSAGLVGDAVDGDSRAGPPVAVGLAFGGEAQGAGPVTVVTFGDGELNTGSFHESANMARAVGPACSPGVPEQPRRGMTPTDHTMKIAHVSDRALGLECQGAHRRQRPPRCSRRIDRGAGPGQSGKGPALLECVTFRFRGHYFGDPMAYIPKDQMTSAEQADPVPRFRAHLASTGVSEDELDQIEAAAQAQVEEAVATVLAAPPPPLDELDRDVYANPQNCPS